MARRDELDIPLPGVMPATGPSYRVPRRKSGLEGNPKRMALIAGGLFLGIAGVVGAVSLSTAPRKTGIPVVEADSRPLRERPAKAGGLEVEGLDPTGGNSMPDSKAAMAPPPEAPAVQTLKQQAAAAAAAAAPKPQPVALTTPVPAAPVAPVAPVASAPAPAPQVAAAAIPAPKPAPAPAASAPVAAPATAAKPAGTGRAQVQLAAVGTEQDAMAEWKRLEKRMPDLLGGRQPAVMKIERDGKILYRLRTGAFADASEAGQFCERVRAKGSGCTVASF